MTESTENKDGRRGGQRRVYFRRRKTCPFSGTNAPAPDYKNLSMLGRFLSESGKIAPARVSAVSASAQRQLAIAVKRARFLALLPYVAS